MKFTGFLLVLLTTSLIWGSIFEGHAQQNLIKAPAPPKGMTTIKGGRSKIGSDTGPQNERPSFQTFINTFYLDTRPVTVGEFRLFVKVNRYITDAEKAGKAPVPDPESQTLVDVEGAYWEFPEGKGGKKAGNLEPVRQVSWNDAQAYANWVGKRLPTEFEMEYVAQNIDQYTLNKLDGSMWYWCENWYANYDDANYYSRQLNRKKTLKGGSTFSEAGSPKTFRPTGRTSGHPASFSYETGIRCARNLKR